MALAMSILILLAMVLADSSTTCSILGGRGLKNLPLKFSNCLLSYNLQKNSKNSPHLILTFLGGLEGLFCWLLSSLSGSYSALGLLLMNLFQKGRKSLSKMILLKRFTHWLSSSFKTGVS